MEYAVRKELGGYFPEDFEKAVFFTAFCAGLADKKAKHMAMEKLKWLASKGGN